MKQTMSGVIRRRKLSAPNIHLQRLMKQSRSGQVRVSLITQSDKLIRGDTVLDVLVLLPVLLNCHEGNRGASILWGVIMARPDLDVAGHREELSSRFVQVTCTAAGEVAAGCANVCMKNGITTEHVV